MMMNFSPSSVSDADAGIMDANAESPPPASEVEIELTYDRAKYFLGGLVPRQ
jgi:hypothetical protein